MNEIELYVNKKFDILKVIEMVLKRKGWGETYTLYSTPTHEVLITMQSYNFENNYATFQIKINEKKGYNYYSGTLCIYPKREDYTLTFVNRLLLKTVRTFLTNYRRNVFEREARDIYPYLFKDDNTTEEWIEIFGLKEQYDKIQELDLSEDDKDDLIDGLIEKRFSSYEDEVCYEPRRIFVEKAMMTDKEPEVLSLIEEIEKELEK